jgi:hypothetical protein
MAKRKVNVPKILCHTDGRVFANWHPRDLDAYCAYFSDEDTPPSPESLKITHTSWADVRSLVWKPVVQVVQVGEPGEVEVGGPYDSETGESV